MKDNTLDDPMYALASKMTNNIKHSIAGTRYFV